MCRQLHSKNDKQNWIRLFDFGIQKYSGYPGNHDRITRFQKNWIIARRKKIAFNCQFGLVVRSHWPELQRASSNSQWFQGKRLGSIRISQQRLQARTRTSQTNNWIREVEIRSLVSDFWRGPREWKRHPGDLQIFKIEFLSVW